MSSQLVSIIVVSAGSNAYLKPCLDSLEQQSHQNKEVIVIDNSLLEEPLSYCAALNKGIGKAKGDFILCLNDDVSLDKDFIREALRGFLLSEKIGMVSGKILRPDAKIIDSTGLFLSPWRTPMERGYNLLDKGQFENKGYIFGVSGAAAFLRKAMLEAIKDNYGYFDLRFGFFFEDLDLAWRANRFGWQGYYIPAAIAYHVRGATARKASGINKPFARRYLDASMQACLLKNRYLTLLKNESWPDFILHLPLIIIHDCAMWAYALFFTPAAIKKLIFPSER
ncbi:MAG: glycosyltransferase [Candidatus Omnitrophota bacterium]